MMCNEAKLAYYENKESRERREREQTLAAMTNPDLAFWMSEISKLDTSFWSERVRCAFLHYAFERFFICHDEHGDLLPVYTELQQMIDTAKPHNIFVWSNSDTAKEESN